MQSSKHFLSFPLLGFNLKVNICGFFRPYCDLRERDTKKIMCTSIDYENYYYLLLIQHVEGADSSQNMSNLWEECRILEYEIVLIYKIQSCFPAVKLCRDSC